jgi:hypothetical protein
MVRCEVRFRLILKDKIMPLTRRSPIVLALVIALFLFCSVETRAWTFSVESASQVGTTSRWAILDGGGWAKVEGALLQFYSPDGQQLQSLSLKGNQFLVASSGGHVLGVISYADPQPKNLNALAFELYDPGGQRLIRVDDPSFSSAVVAPGGNAFVGIDGAEGLPSSVLRFYDAQGNRRDTLAVERFEGGKFSRDGSRFFYVTARDGLRVVSADGAALNRFGRVDHWAASVDGRVVVTAVGREIKCYREGTLISSLPWRADTILLRALAVSPDGNHAAAISAAHAAVFRTDSSAFLWEVACAESNWNFRGIDLRDGVSLVALGLDYDPGPDSPDRHLRSRCDVYDHAGRLVYTEEDQPERWGTLFPAVRFDDDRGGLVFVNRDRFKFLKIGPS